MAMIELIRRILDERGRLAAPVRTLAASADLYEAGLSSFAAVEVMLALEAALGVEFPKHMLRRRNCSSIDAILACLRAAGAEASGPPDGGAAFNGHAGHRRASYLESTVNS